MTFFVAFAVLLLAASIVLVLAGREALRINGYPQHRVHDLGDLFHLASVGWAALNRASNEAARQRMTRRY
jgi:hypothetical protein